MLNVSNRSGWNPESRRVTWTNPAMRRPAPLSSIKPRASARRRARLQGDRAVAVPVSAFLQRIVEPVMKKSRRRRDTEEHRRHQRQRQRKSEHASVDARLRDSRNGRPNQRNSQSMSNAASARQRCRPGTPASRLSVMTCRTIRERAAPMAKRSANPVHVPRCGSTGGCQISARQQEHKAHSAEQEQQRTSRDAHHVAQRGL